MPEDEISTEKLDEELAEKIITETAEASLAEDEEAPETEEEEEIEEDAAEKDAVSQSADADTALELIEEVCTQVNRIGKKMDDLAAVQESQGQVIHALAVKSKLGTVPKAFSAVAETKTGSLKDQFMAMSGPDTFAFYQKNKSELAKQL